MRYPVLTIALVVAAGTASACKEMPSFGLDWINWQATHVVLARVDGNTDKLEVLESWRGDLARGTRVPIERLSAAATSDYLAVQVAGHPTHRELRGERAVFFLQKQGDRLIPVGWLITSHVWIEEGKVYANYVNSISGATELELDETQLHATVVTAGDLKARYERATATADLAARAKALLELHAETTGWVRNIVESSFSTCPKETAHELAKLLARRSNLEDHAEILSWVQRLDRDEGLAASKAIVKDELARWKRIAPTLARAPEEAERRELDAHLARLATAAGFVSGVDKGPEITALRSLFQRPELAQEGPLVLRAIDPPCVCTK